MLAACTSRAMDPMASLNTGMNAINTAINVISFAQKMIDESTQTRAQADIAIASYSHIREEGFWDDGKPVKARAITFMYRKRSLSEAPISYWHVSDAKGNIVDRGTNALPVRLALREMHCTNEPFSGRWTKDSEQYLLMGAARIIQPVNNTVRSPGVRMEFLDVTLTGLRHVLDPAQPCDAAIVTESLPPKRLRLKFTEPVFFRLESTNRPEIRRNGSTHHVVPGPRPVQNRIYDIPETLLVGWEPRHGQPRLEDVPGMLARAEAAGRAPGAIRTKAIRAVLELFWRTYADGLPEAQIMPSPIHGRDGALDFMAPIHGGMDSE